MRNLANTEECRSQSGSVTYLREIHPTTNWARIFTQTIQKTGIELKKPTNNKKNDKARRKGIKKRISKKTRARGHEIFASMRAFCK